MKVNEREAMTQDVSKQTILLVEDSEADIFFFKRALKKTQLTCDLVLAEDGRAAISILSDPERAKTVSIVFLDLKLPFVNGFDVLKWMQTEKFEKAPRVVVLSGSPHLKDIQMARELGAIDYLVKPVSPEMISRFLRE